MASSEAPTALIGALSSAAGGFILGNLVWAATKTTCERDAYYERTVRTDGSYGLIWHPAETYDCFLVGQDEHTQYVVVGVSGFVAALILAGLIYLLWGLFQRPARS